MYLIDGFPRSQENLDSWERIFKGEAVNVKFVLFLDCSEETMIKRIQFRGQQAGAEKRSDDDLETLRKRIAINNATCMPIVQKLKTFDMVKTVDANKERDEVWQQIRQVFQGYI